jgi:hypothetical protein
MIYRYILYIINQKFVKYLLFNVVINHANRLYLSPLRKPGKKGKDIPVKGHGGP